MNKLVGYCTIEVEGKTIPVKLGSYAMERFCELMGVGLSEIPTLYEMKEVEVEGKVQTLPVFKKPFDFAAAILWSGANYASLATGGEGYTIWDAYEWLNQIGIDSAQLKPVYATFWQSLYGDQTDKKKVQTDGEENTPDV